MAWQNLTSVRGAQQTHCVYKLYLDDKYTIIEAKNYLSLMQEYAPHLSGMVLADSVDIVSQPESWWSGIIIMLIIE